MTMKAAVGCDTMERIIKRIERQMAALQAQLGTATDAVERARLLAEIDELDIDLSELQTIHFEMCTPVSPGLPD